MIKKKSNIFNFDNYTIIILEKFAGIDKI